MQAQRKRSKSIGHTQIDLAALRDIAAKHKERKRSTGNTFDITALKESLALAEIKAAAASQKIKETVLTPQRKITAGQEQIYVPPKQLLLYLVRMGSFTSIPKVKGQDNQDNDLEFPNLTEDELLQRCTKELEGLPPPIQRKMTQFGVKKDQDSFSVLQWNQLSQCLGTEIDKFVKTPPTAFDWRTRRWRLLEEVVRHSPDIICLQEVDHVTLYKRALGSIGYVGHFVPKPDSPCIYLKNNTGPDGCAIFYKKEKFSLVSGPHTRVIEVWRVQSNQVILNMTLKHRESGREVNVATTHLKARSGALLSTLRNEQGKDIIDWVDSIKKPETPIIICGDFNAEPTEPVFQTMTQNNKLPLKSAYKICSNPENMENDALEYTTWKVRESGEQKHILDYIFHSPDTLETIETLDMPTEEQIGESRVPSLAFPSDHLSLLAKFRFSGE